MDFEFRKDVTGELQADFSMEHRAFGIWLMEEVGSQISLLSPVYRAIERLQCADQWEYSLEGVAWNLRLNTREAEVCDARIDFDADDLSDSSDQLVEEFAYYDDESRACCGLDDFQVMLVEWQRFIEQR